MAADKLSWVFELLDRISGPANKIDKALNGINKATKAAGAGLSTLDKMTQGIGNTFGSRVGAAFSSIANGVKSAGASLRAGASSWGDTISMLGAGAAGIAAAIAAVVAKVATAGARFVGSALIFKENSLAGFEAILGSKDEANAVLAKATAFASKTPFETPEVIEMTTKLLTRGFKSSELDKLMLGVGDVGASLGTEKMESVIGALGKMRSAGKLTGETMAMLADAGINSQLVFDSLAKKLGKSRAEIEKMMSAGQITDAMGIEATMDAIAKGLSGGELGGAMKKKSETMSGLFSTLASVPSELVFSADMSKLIEPVKSFIKILTENLGPDTPNGQRIIKMLELIGGVLGETFAKVKDKLPMMLDIGVAALEKVVTILSAVWKGINSSFGKTFMPALERLFAATKNQDPKKLAESIETWVKIGKAVGWVLGIMLGVAALTFDIIDLMIGAALAPIAAWEWMTEKMMGLGRQLKESFTGMSWSEIGISIVKGIIDGLLSMLSPASGAMNLVGDSLISSLKGKLGIASPSKVFEGFGLDTGAGFINGLNASGIGAAMANAIKLPTVGAPNVPKPTTPMNDVMSGPLGPLGLFGGLSSLIPGAPAAAGGLEGLLAAAGIGGAPAKTNDNAVQPAATANQMTDASQVKNQEQNFQISIPQILIQMAAGDSPEAAGKGAADSFLGQLTSGLKGLAGEAGG